MDIVLLQAQEYAEKYSEPEDDLLKEVALFTTKYHSHAHMLSGHLQGGLLQMISRMMRPRRILEIGTFTGYSALCLATGLAHDGILHTIELRTEDAQHAEAYFRRSVFADKIKLHIGDAKHIIGQLRESWDLVFIDADKVSYIDYFNLVFPAVNSNGFILADNVLFHGQVLEEEIRGKNARAIQAFNDHVHQRSDIQKLLLPVRDGIYLIRKR